ncbi:MAG TPA: 5'-3' exonuclease H3TH domain-containing protein [Anaerolineales bacterium]|nr:5'-3' exonuclease H3TH domain-containing protein [Anaerolineales bacterium]
MKIHLIDGTYELFRNHFGAPPKKSPASGQEVGATLGLMRSLLMLLQSPDVTHVGVAFDHIIESFRNDLYTGYKTGQGVDPLLLAQFPLAEQAVAALGVVVWPMVEFEADDAIATAAVRFKKTRSVEQIIIASPDKDLSQLVSGTKIVCWDRRRELIIDEAGVIEKFGVSPQSIPDWLGVVGDSADGFPGIPGWGAKSASAVLAHYKKLEAIPKDPAKWQVSSISPGRAASLAESLARNWEEAMLFRKLATLQPDVPLKEDLNDLKWRGARADLKEFCAKMGDEKIPTRVQKWQ